MDQEPGRMMTRSRPHPRDPAALIVGAIGAQVVGGLAPQLSPLMIGGLMSGLSLSERAAGFVATVELLALAVTAIAIAPVLPRLSCRRVGLAAVVLALLAQTGSIFSVSLAPLALLRGVSGIGEGALYAVSLSVVAARSSNPDKVYGYFQAVWALGSVALFSAGGELTAAFAQRGIFGLAAGVTLLLAPLLFLIPNARAESGDRDPAGPAQASALLGGMTLVAIALYLTASAAIYTFTAPLGERAGLDTSTIGYVLTAGTLIGLAGAGASSVLHVRCGRAIPITGFCAGFALVTFALCLSRDATVYSAALIASIVIYYFSIPYLYGLAAALDRSGRWAAAASSAYLLGFAAGPLIGGILIERTGYAGFAVVCFAVTAVAWGLTMAVCRSLNGRARATLSIDALS